MLFWGWGEDKPKPKPKASLQNWKKAVGVLELQAGVLAVEVCRLDLTLRQNL